MGFIEIFKLVVQLLPALIEAIKVVEKVLPTPGNGATKLGMVREIMQVSFEAAGEGNFEHVWSVASKVISALVGVFNVSGVFVKQ